jgi:sodium/hydrogen antiporter
MPRRLRTGNAAACGMPRAWAAQNSQLGATSVAMGAFDISLAVIAATVLLTGVFSLPLKRTLLQEPMIAVAVGIVVGPFFLGWIDLTALEHPHEFLYEAARITLAVAVMGVALRLERSSIRRFWSPALALVTIGMVAMWGAATLLIMGVLGLPFWLAALIGAAVTPTDPVVAMAIVTGPFAEKHLPDALRSTLSLESGANDGLAYLLILLPLLMLAHPPGEAWSAWLVDTLVKGVLLAIVLGLAIGYGAARLLHWAHRAGFIESYSYLMFTVALTLFTLGMGHVIGAESLISVFVAGLAFDFWSDTGEKHDEENVQEAVSKLCTIPMLVLFGTALPIGAWVEMGWALALLAIATLLLRRPPVLALMWPLLRGTLGAREIAFLGWFGPMGVAAIFYAAFALREGQPEVVWHAVSALVFASIVVHGVTAWPFTRLYATARERGRRR